MVHVLQADPSNLIVISQLNKPNLKNPHSWKMLERLTVTIKQVSKVYQEIFSIERK